MAEVASGDAVVRVAEKGKFDGEIVVGVLGELLTRVVIDNVKKLSDSHSEWWEHRVVAVSDYHVIWIVPANRSGRDIVVPLATVWGNTHSRGSREFVNSSAAMTNKHKHNHNHKLTTHTSRLHHPKPQQEIPHRHPIATNVKHLQPSSSPPPNGI